MKKGDKRIQIIEGYSDQFLSKVKRFQPDIFNRLLPMLSAFDIKGGYIQAGAKNGAIIETIGKQTEDYIMSSEYRDALKEYGKGFGDIKNANDEVFEANIREFNPKEYYDQAIKASQRNTVELLANDAVRKQFVIPLKDILNNSVSGSSTFADAVKTLREYIEGTDKLDGSLLRYVKTIARDAYAVADRRYSMIVSDDLGVEWFFYDGGLVRDSREFCIARAGKYFHITEIQSWAGLDWQGKAKGTDGGTIFSLLGGYGCLHVLIPVAEYNVPPKDLARIKK